MAEWGQQGKLREAGEGGGEGEQPASVLLGGCQDVGSDCMRSESTRDMSTVDTVIEILAGPLAAVVTVLSTSVPLVP